jgi:hypothetical protein
MKEIKLRNKHFLRSIFINGEVSIITKYYTISHPFHDNILRTIKFVINDNFNLKKI